MGNQWAVPVMFPFLGWNTLITNADDGVLLSWWDTITLGQSSPAPHWTRISGAGMTDSSGPVIAGQEQVAIFPMLQLEDGSFVGVAFVGDKWASYNQLVPYMVGVDPTGSVRWSVANEQPQIATQDGGIIGKSGIIYDYNGSATGQNGPITYSWLGNAYQVGSVEQVLANPLYYALSFWAFQRGNQSGNNAAQFRRDSISNDKVKGKLKPAFWKKFANSHCGAVLANRQGMLAMTDNYSLQVVQEKQGMTNFYDIGNSGVGGLPLREVTGGQYGSNVTLANYLSNSGATAATANWGNGRQTAVVLQPSVLSQGHSEFTLVHEIVFHAYAALSDDTVFANTYFQQQGLWRPAGSTATANISTWMSTDCTCTPGNPATPSCQVNAATW